MSSFDVNLCFRWQDPGFYLEVEFLRCELPIKQLGWLDCESYRKSVVEVWPHLLYLFAFEIIITIEIRLVFIV